MKIDELLKKYPRIRLVSPENSDWIFSVIDKTSLHTSRLQVSFDRKPDFFSFLQVQGEKAFVFTFHNTDGSAHGMAVLTFRQMHLNGKKIWLGYASDLRTSKQLERETRIQWRKMYAQIIQSAHLIEEFKCHGIVTAVWDENSAAQAALVNYKKSKDFQYVPIQKYVSYSVWGKWKLWKNTDHIIRKAKPSDLDFIENHLLRNTDLNWEQQDLKRTLNMFNKNLSDFWILEKGNQIQAFTLDISQTPFKKLKILSWPKTLAVTAKLLALIGKRPVKLHEPIEMKQLIFFRSLAGSLQHNLVAFLDHFWNENLKRPKDEQFHIINYFDWNNSKINLLRDGYFFSSIKGSLYRVTSTNDSDQLVDIYDYKTIEGNFL